MPPRSTGQLIDLDAFRPRRRKAVYFSRHEMNALLSLFSRHVLAGSWRDYSLDNRCGFAAFCVYRRTQDAPLYRIVRLAPGSYPDGDYLVIRGAARRRRGASLNEVLGAIAPPLRMVTPQAL